MFFLLCFIGIILALILIPIDLALRTTTLLNLAEDEITYVT